MTDQEFKWRPYPETLPPLPIKEDQLNHYLVTVAYSDGSHTIDCDYIKSDGKWMRYTGTKRANVVAWMVLPSPYYRTPDQESFF